CIWAAAGRAVNPATPAAKATARAPAFIGLVVMSFLPFEIGVFCCCGRTAGSRPPFAPWTGTGSLGAHPVLEPPDPLDFQDHHVAVLQPARRIHRVADPRGGARRENVA